MAIIDLFSKRHSSKQGFDVFSYDSIPKELRVQVIHIWGDAIGNPSLEGPKRVYLALHRLLGREYGVFYLSRNLYRKSDFNHLREFLLSCEDYARVCDVIELSFRVIENFAKHEAYQRDAKTTVTPKEAIDELNGRFLEHGIGYQYECGVLIRKDSELLHSEVVRPAFQLLNDKRFAGANDEFLKAHEHCRHRRWKETLNECLKAFESTMKCICDIRKWSYQKNDTAKRLIEVCLSHGLIPEFQLAQLSALRSLLETGVPTVRNKLSGHGQGAVPVTVSERYASYLLHLTATTIKFLIESGKNLPRLKGSGISLPI